MFVWLEVYVGLERGEKAAQLSLVPTQRAALARASFWNDPSLQQKQMHRLTRGSRAVRRREAIIASKQQKRPPS